MQFRVVVSSSDPLTDVVGRMNSCVESKFIAGLAVVVDETDQVTGVLTDGDLRRRIQRGASLDCPVGDVANPDPLTLTMNENRSLMRRDFIRKADERQVFFRDFKHIIIVDESNKFLDVWRREELAWNHNPSQLSVAVIGMGYVGLTLGLVLAESGFHVVGIDQSGHVINGLRAGNLHIFESGMEGTFESVMERHSMVFCSDLDTTEADVYVVCVGTPIGDGSGPDLGALRDACEKIAGSLKAGDLVIFRSTVPLGCTRKELIPILDRGGELIAGKDFHVAFAPERTIEGRALKELRTLPQIVGGLDAASLEAASAFFDVFSQSVVRVQSLEAAEIIKLINNTWRDVSFGFANEVALVCEEHNINAFELIEAANEGYPRNPISSPSPGVGGACLSKDPIIYGSPISTEGFVPRLGLCSREIDDLICQSVVGKVRDFAGRVGKEVSELTILVIGLAFKGHPETSDTRGSTALKILDGLGKVGKVRVKDFVVPDHEIDSMGFESVETIESGFRGADVILVLNNHYQNSNINLGESVKKASKPFLFFDGWNSFNRNEIEACYGGCYSTLGYVTEEEDYLLVPLRRNKEFISQDNRVEIFLPGSRGGVIHSDSEKKMHDSDDILYWLSGGGSILFGEKHLLIVKRSGRSLTNPGRYSLFTGRASTMAELFDPRLLVRELFEEIVLMRDGDLLYPEFEGGEFIVAKAAGTWPVSLRRARKVKFSLEELDLPKGLQEVCIHAPGTRKQSRTKLVAGENGDLNAIYLFASGLNPRDLVAVDCEDDPGAVPMGDREIYSLDIETLEGVRIDSNGKGEHLKIAEHMMSDTLKTTLSWL